MRPWLRNSMILDQPKCHQPSSYITIQQCLAQSPRTVSCPSSWVLDFMTWHGNGLLPTRRHGGDWPLLHANSPLESQRLSAWSSSVLSFKGRSAATAIQALNASLTNAAWVLKEQWQLSTPFLCMCTKRWKVEWHNYAWLDASECSPKETKRI